MGREARIRKETLEAVPRALEEVQKEYTAVCVAIGEREYRRRVLCAELDQLSQRAHELNAEAERAKARVEPPGGA